MSRSRFALALMAALALLAVTPGSALAQLGGGFGGMGGFGGGGLGGGGFGGGGFGGGGFGQQGAGVVVSPEGVLRVQSYTDPGGRLTRAKFEAAKASLDGDLVRPSDLRKVSLTRLERVAAEYLERGEELPEEVRYMAGLLRIQYVFFYPETGDIVVAGPAEGFVADPSGRMRGMTSGRPVLDLEDLVVALRAYPPTGERTPFIGCSIDPTQEGLQRMQRFLGSLRGIGPRDAPAIANGLVQSLGLQDVTISGISPNTHFAQVLVEADYRMKLIGIGRERPPVDITSYVARANPRDVARNALLRWYFTPWYECVRVSEDEMGMELCGWGVKLVGADEMVAGDGTRGASGRVDRAGRAFCDEFTRMYPTLADREPVFAQLRNVIDMSVAAAFIQQKDYYTQAGWDMELFGDESRFPVEYHTTPRRVESAVNVIWKGNTLMTPIGGGVAVQPEQALAREYLIPDEEGTVESTRAQVDIRQLADDQWWWD